MSKQGTDWRETNGSDAAQAALDEAIAAAQTEDEEPDFLDSPFLDLEASLTLRQCFRLFVRLAVTLAVTGVGAAVLSRFCVWVWVGR